MECTPFTDAGATRSERSVPASIATVPDDRLTVADVCALLQVRKSVVYAACDYGDLECVRFESTVQLLPDRMRGRIRLATRRPAPHASGPLGGAAAHCESALCRREWANAPAVR